ncbi:hypothetical protein B0H13DRAFT_1851029 [Mycena leptocephala]|nr:hypothetical protein B0H13DRAFT_1851029 [Mycena leptocephala]
MAIFALLLLNLNLKVISGPIRLGPYSKFTVFEGASNAVGFVAPREVLIIPFLASRASAREFTRKVWPHLSELQRKEWFGYYPPTSSSILRPIQRGMDASRRAEEAPSNASLGDVLCASLPLPSSSMGKKRAEPDTPAKRPVGRPPKKPKTTPAASQTPKLTVTIPPATRKTRQSGSNSASAAASTSASVSTSTSDSETSSNVVIEIASDLEMLDDDREAEDIDAAAIAILGRGDSDYLDAKDDEDDEEQGVNSDEEPEPQEEEEEEEEENIFDVEFVIPVTSSATDTLTYSSEITHLDFTQNVADEMNIRRRDLEIGYKLSHWTKDVLPRVINTPFTSSGSSTRYGRSARSVHVQKTPRRTSANKAEPKKPASKKPKSKASFRWLYPIHVLNILSQASATKAESSDSEVERCNLGRRRLHPSTTQLKHNTNLPPPLVLILFILPPRVPIPTHITLLLLRHIPSLLLKSSKTLEPRRRFGRRRIPNPLSKIDDWLLDLDTSERRRRAWFSKFGAMLRNEGFARVVQIWILALRISRVANQPSAS